MRAIISGDWLFHLSKARGKVTEIFLDAFHIPTMSKYEADTHLPLRLDGHRTPLRQVDPRISIFMPSIIPHQEDSSKFTIVIPGEVSVHSAEIQVTHSPELDLENPLGDIHVIEPVTKKCDSVAKYFYQHERDVVLWPSTRASPNQVNLHIIGFDDVLSSSTRSLEFFGFLDQIQDMKPIRLMADLKAGFVVVEYPADWRRWNELRPGCQDMKKSIFWFR